MVKKKAAGGLKAKVRKHVAEHKGDETNYGLVDLPGGIKNGVARLQTITFGTYREGTNNAGEYYCRMQAVVKEPDSVQGDPEKGSARTIPVKGLFTSQMEPICDTEVKSGRRAGETITTGDHVGNILNEFRKLGLNTEEYDDDDLEEMAKDLENAKPYFRFSTSWRDDDDHSKGTWENWDGDRGMEGYEPPSDDEEEPEEEEETEEEEEGTEEEEGGEEAEEEGGEDDLNALAAAADDDEDQEAQARLTEIASEADIDVNDWETWADVVAAIEDAQEGEGTEDEEGDDEEEVIPNKGDVFYYKPKGKRSKVQCEVSLVNKTKQTVSLRNTEDNKTIYKQVAWDQLDDSP